jgi:hypothetical protein
MIDVFTGSDSAFHLFAFDDHRDAAARILT